MSNRELFGTDGIRGVAGQYPLDHQGAEQVGRAIGMHFTEAGETVLLGHDPRESSPALVEAVTRGLVAVGAHVVQVGVVPTPALAYLTKTNDAVCGVMITASHNAYTDNGIKVFNNNGTKLPDNTEVALNNLINSTIPDRGRGSTSQKEDAIPAYEEFLISSAGARTLQDCSIAVDTANGATSGVAERVFSRLGAKVTPLFDQPNGKNINDGCGATQPQHLQKFVKDQQLVAGIAFDGDGDRVILVDEKGRELDGDYILYILAITSQSTGVVATIMSNMGLEIALRQQNIAFERTDVGDRYVLGGLEKTGFTLGGEKAGHIIMSNLAATGDGLLVAVQTLLAVQSSDKSLADWFDELTLLPQALVNIPVANKALLDDETVQAYLTEEIEKLGDAGRINVRPSGTEPKIRVMVEAPDAKALANQIASRVDELFKAKEA